MEFIEKSEVNLDIALTRVVIVGVLLGKDFIFLLTEIYYYDILNKEYVFSNIIFHKRLVKIFANLFFVAKTY